MTYARFGTATAVALLSILSAAAADAAKPVERNSAEIAALARCRTIATDGERLRCYDAAAATLVDAEQRADIVVVDRKEIESSRKSLFGLALPDISLFKRKGVEIEDLKEIEGTLASASTNASGQWLFRLDDGAAWQQIDTYSLNTNPKAGDKVVIRRAAMGSYKAAVGRNAGVRVRRLR